MRRLISIASLAAILITVLPAEFASLAVEDEKIESEKDKAEPEKDETNDLDPKLIGAAFAVVADHVLAFGFAPDNKVSSLFSDEVPTPPPLRS